MVTTEIFEKLKTLQVVLGRKYELEKKIDETPKQLNSQIETLSKFKKEFIQLNEEYEKAKEEVLRLKNELEETVKVREMGEKNMDNITTHREYEALEKQISEATLKEEEIRKEKEKQDKIVSELSDSIQSSEALMNAQENDLNASKQKIDEEMSQYKEELKTLNDQENEIAPSIDQEILFKFERIIQRNSQGIVAVKNGVCEGCHMILPAQFANEVHEGESIFFCPYCSRILYYEEADEESQETYFNDAGSLADFGDDDDDYSDDDYDSDNLDDDFESDNLDESEDDSSDGNESDEDSED